MSPPKAVLQLVFQTLALLSKVLPLAFASSVLSPSVDHQASLQAQPLCRQTTIPVNVVAHPRFISLSTPQNQSQVVALLTNLTSIKSNLTADIVHEPRVLNATYNIWTVLCFPLFTRARTVEFAIHGLNYDHKYWDPEWPASLQYSYANAAIEAGHAIFMYDRLGMHAIIIASLSSGTLSGVVNNTNPGVGRSDKPDGIQEVQHDTEIEVAVQLIRHIKDGRTGFQFEQIIGLGHSLGSIQLTGINTKYPDLLDATILTGFSPYTGALGTAIASAGLTIAAVQDFFRFGHLNYSYLTTGTYGDQAVFFYYPFFEPAFLDLALQQKQTSTIGEFLTLKASVAENYTRPVFVVTGDKDSGFCGGNCYQSIAGFDNLISYSQILFPNASEFDYSIQTNTGHAINFHYGAQDTFRVIQSWIAQLELGPHSEDRRRV